MNKLEFASLILLLFLLSSCGGYMLETGLSSDQGTLNPLNGSNGASGIGATIGLRYKRMLWDNKSDSFSRHGVGGELMYHLNGYGTNGDSNPFFYRSLTGRYYYLFDDNSAVKCYLSGRFGFGGQKINVIDYEPIGILGASMDIHFFEKEFIYLSPKLNYIRNLSHGGHSVSIEVTFGVMLCWQKYE